MFSLWIDLTKAALYFVKIVHKSKNIDEIFYILYLIPLEMSGKQITFLYDEVLLRMVKYKVK